MAEPVTAAELAEALRTIRVTRSVDVLGVETLLARYDAQQAAKSQECTGFAASWCPRCGDCTCDRLPSGERINECAPGNTCPLHGFRSTHAEPQQTEASKPARDESRDVCVYDDGETLGCVYWEDYANNTGLWSVEVERYVPFEQLKSSE